MRRHCPSTPRPAISVLGGEHRLADPFGCDDRSAAAVDANDKCFELLVAKTVLDRLGDAVAGGGPDRRFAVDDLPATVTTPIGPRGSHVDRVGDVGFQLDPVVAAAFAVVLAAEVRKPRLERPAVAELVDQAGGQRRLGQVSPGRVDGARRVAHISFDRACRPRLGTFSRQLSSKASPNACALCAPRATCRCGCRARPPTCRCRRDRRWRSRPACRAGP